MHVMLIGDLGTPHSTGSHLVRALQDNGHDVLEVNERPHIWVELARPPQWAQAIDFVVWNSTPGYAPFETYDEQAAFLNICSDKGIPVVGYHLDLYWSIPEREQWVAERPFFRSDLVVTADGGHQERWENAGVDHVWFPPAVLGSECERGNFREEFASDIAFVGSWAGTYHRISTHRHELVGWLKSKYGARCAFWPKRGQHAIRGQDLRDLYASVRVVVGDSCMVPHLTHYWSDRVPETTGRGAFLLHPYVEGLLQKHPHLWTWPAGHWDHLAAQIESVLRNDEERQRITKLNREDTLLNNTYERRMMQLVELLQERNLI
jgi:hypothetical protein